VSGRTTDSGHIIIDVIDHSANGNGDAAKAADWTTSTGLGLTLVKGLVGRELRGRLSLAQREHGGTIATVEFPVEIRPTAAGIAEEANHDHARN
jgi:two-component sensor histidine kinase